MNFQPWNAIRLGGKLGKYTKDKYPEAFKVYMDKGLMGKRFPQTPIHLFEEGQDRCGSVICARNHITLRNCQSDFKQFAQSALYFKVWCTLLRQDTVLSQILPLKCPTRTDQPPTSNSQQFAKSFTAYLNTWMRANIDRSKWQTYMINNVSSDKRRQSQPWMCHVLTCFFPGSQLE